MAEIGVDYATMQELSANVDRAHGHHQELFDDLMSRLQPLFESWGGEGAEAHSTAQNEWNKSTGELNQVLAQVSAVVKQAEEGYQDTDRKIAGSFG